MPIFNAVMKRKQTIIAVWLALLLALNLYILINRNEGYKYMPYASYNQLYVTDASLYIQELFFTADSLQITLSQQPDNSSCRLLVDTLPHPILLKAHHNQLVIPISTGLHQYTIEFANGGFKTIRCAIDHDTFKQPVVNEWLYCNIPGPGISPADLNTWLAGTNNYTPQSLAAARQLLMQNTHTFQYTTDSAQLLAIARFCAGLCNAATGTSGDSLGSMAPLEQIHLAQQCQAHMDCGNYAAIMQYLLVAANLPNRVITYQGPAGNWRYGVHYMNEVYLRQQQQWVLVDALNNIYMPHDSTRFYNAADLRKITATNGFSGKYIYSFYNDSLVQQPYTQKQELHTYYNGNGSNICYLHPGGPTTVNSFDAFLEFYSFGRDYDLYSDEHQNNWTKIIVKELAAMAFVLLFIYFVIISFFGRYSKVKKQP
jgi:hypothetical protein